MSGHNFKKKFGQNFLTDKNLLDAIVRDAGVTENDEVLEIGSGAGALTTAISNYAKRTVSFEIDKELEFDLLALNLSNTTFVFEDALKKPLGDIEKYFDGEYKLVANLPYYITTPLIFKFLEESDRIRSMTIMVQKEVADRITSNKGGKDYGVLTIMIAFYGSATITRNVSRKMFYPVPNVDSAVVRIDIDRDKFKDVDKKGFSQFIKACFSMRRKTLLNNLSSGYGVDKAKLHDVLGANILSKRAEEFDLYEFVEIYKKLKTIKR